ncbi:MAG: hypothetical protein Q7S53_00855 [bacterium]|nr:hypothetical protein [bacterium]
MLKQRLLQKVIALSLLVVFSLLAAGCSNIPKEIQKDADQLSKRIEAAKKKIGDKQSQFEEFKNSESYGFHKPYSERENWAGKFDEARAKTDTAQSLFDNELKPILDRGKAEEAENAKAQINRINATLDEADYFADYPGNRAEFLKKVKDEGKQMIQTASNDVASSQKFRDELTAPVEKAKVDFPGKKDDLTMRQAEFNRRVDESATALTSAKAQEAAASPDYAVWGDSCVTITTNNEWIKGEDQNVRNKLNELPRSYSWTLVDQREDFFVTIQKTVWDDWAEIDNDKDYTYESRQVDRDTYAYFESLSDEDALDLGKIDQDKWNSLNIDQREGPNDSTEKFYVGDLPYTCYHKYLVEENGQVHEEDWKEVDEATFAANEADLGMVIMTKPVGLYEEDVIKVASPPGFAYVDNPRYGQWNTDGSGNSFWVFYGQYAFISNMLGGNSIYRNDWDTWNRDYRGRQPYYGKDEGYGTYSGNYAGTTYGRSGGIEAEDPSVREAGSSARGGGPGGGGK